MLTRGAPDLEAGSRLRWCLVAKLVLAYLHLATLRRTGLLMWVLSAVVSRVQVVAQALLHRHERAIIPVVKSIRLPNYTLSFQEKW